MGKDGVPINKCWPLRLGSRMIQEYILPGTILDFEDQQQQDPQQCYQCVTKFYQQHQEFSLTTAA
eukprot:4272688-Ditylum_brightwellii.AAC.1